MELANSNQIWILICKILRDHMKSFVNYVLNNQNDPITRLDLGSYKESSKVEKTADVQSVNVIEEEDESAEDDYELRRRVKGKEVEETRNTPSPTTIRSPRILVMEESLPKTVDACVKELTKTQVPIYVSEGLIMERQHNQVDVAKMSADAIQQERENLQAEISS
ncbi:hypothetical protein Tco_0553391 [Tanacetum coccineum]